MKRPTEKRSTVFASATVLAAIISGVAAVLAAILPWLLKTHNQSQAADDKAVESVRVPADTLAGVNLAPAGSLAPSSAITPIPDLTYGVWSIVKSIDEAGTDFSGSMLKFISQRAVSGGIQANGFFEWRSENQVLGREFVEANFDAATRQIFIEGKSVECPTGRLAIGSYSVRVSEDGRQLLDGTWGDTPGNQHGIFGKWQARR